MPTTITARDGIRSSRSVSSTIDTSFGVPRQAGVSDSMTPPSFMQESNLFDFVERGLLFPAKPVVLNGSPIPIHLIGDAAYPLKSWLLKPFPNAMAVDGPVQLPPQQGHDGGGRRIR